jgi:hypothetical protein
VRQATKERGSNYPLAVDNDYAIWTAFDNHYWPALYFVDEHGTVGSCAPSRVPCPSRQLKHHTPRAGNPDTTAGSWRIDHRAGSGGGRRRSPRDGYWPLACPNAAGVAK